MPPSAESRLLHRLRRLSAEDLLLPLLLQLALIILAALAIALAGIALPFAPGVGLGRATYPHLGEPVEPLSFSLFLGTSLSITAIPVLGRMMLELGITRTRLATVTTPLLLRCMRGTELEPHVLASGFLGPPPGEGPGGPDDPAAPPLPSAGRRPV